MGDNFSNRYNDLTNLDNFLEDNFSQDESDEVKEEVNDIYKALIAEETIVIYIDNFLTPSTLGLGFFQYNNLITAINMITPDLFRKSFVRDTVEFVKSSSLICPTYSRMPAEANIKYSYNNYFQILIDEQIIKGFLYFNFSSNPFVMSIENIPFRFLKYRWYDENPARAETFNSSNFTLAKTFFNYFYDDNSLLVQLLKFNTTMNTSGQFGINNTNFPPYFIPWITSYTCLSTKTNPNDFIVYNNYENPLFNNVLQYSDMLYLFKSRPNYRFVATETAEYTGNESLKKAIDNNNIFKLLEYAEDVYLEI